MGNSLSNLLNKQQKPLPFDKKYEINKTLGKGAFATVYKGTRKSNNEEVAIKIIDLERLRKSEEENLRREISIMRVLDHPHIVKLLEATIEERKAYLVMEEMKGGELFDRIVRKTTYNEKEASDVIRILLETVAFLHERDVVHRDLKPENLLLEDEKNDTAIKIADFGFAKNTSELMDDELLCGTPGYVAPEILKGVKYSDKVDVWSIGVITYILLGGYPPFYDEDQDKLFWKIRNGKYAFHEKYWKNISRDAKDLITKMLVVDQHQRWAAKQLLEHEWIKDDAQQLMTRDISFALEELKKFNARRKLRAGVNAVRAVTKLGSLYSKTSSLGSETIHEESVDVNVENKA